MTGTNLIEHLDTLDTPTAAVILDGETEPGIAFASVDCYYYIAYTPDEDHSRRVVPVDEDATYRVWNPLAVSDD